MKRILLFTMMCLFGLFSLNAQDVPQNLVATANGLSSITLTWDAVEGSEDYYVYKDGQLWANTSGATTYTENGLAAGTEYCFNVSAVKDNWDTESELSAEVCATTESVQLAENEIVIGTATTKYYSPFLTILGGGSWFEAIYKSEEIGKACTISELAFSYKDGNETSADINIYLAETAKDEFASPADVTAESELTLVYSGNGVILCDEEWETFVLNVPFEYSGENNLVVVVTTENTSKANHWNCYEDANSVLIKDVVLDSKKPVMKLTLGKGSNVPSTPKPYRLVSKESGYSTTSYLYDVELDNRVLRIDNNGTIDYLSYNAQGQLESYVMSMSDTTIVSEVNYIYDANNRLVSYTELVQSWQGSDEFQTEITYNAEGKVEKVVCESQGSVTTYEYNAEGLLVEKSTGYEYDGVVEYDSKEIYTYENGKLVKVGYMYYDWNLADGSFSLAEETVYIYDANGNCMSEKFYTVDENDVKVLYETTEYYYNTEVLAEDVYTFEYPHFALTNTVKPSSVNVLTRELRYYSYVDEATGEVVNHSHAYTTYNYDPEIETPLIIPAAPQNLVATAEGTSIILTWDAVEGADYYNVRCNDELIAETTETSYTVENWTAGREYCFTVTMIKSVALAEIAESEPSNEACATVEESEKPNQPEYKYRISSFYVEDGWQTWDYNYSDATGTRLLTINEIELMTPYELVDSLFYDEKGNIIKLSTWQKDEEEWVYSCYLEYTYNEQNLRATRKNYNNFGTTMELGGTYYYNYDVNGKMTDWRLEFFDLEEYQKGVIEYNKDGQKVSETIQQYDFETTHLRNYQLIEYEYDGHGNLVNEVMYGNLMSGLDTLAPNTYKYYEYDDFGNCIQFEQTTASGQVQERRVYTYDTSVLAENVFYYSNPENDFPVLPQMNNMLKSFEYYAENDNGEIVYVTDYIFDYEEIEKPGSDIPAAPQNLVATVNGQSSITLTWDAVEGAEDYYVYKDGTMWANTSGATTYTENGLAAGTECCFAVQAAGAAGESELSAEVCATVAEPEEPILPEDACYVYFELSDIYGDGWNGNYLEVAYNGKTQKLEMTNGIYEEYYLAITTGSYVAVTYVVPDSLTTWPEENSLVVRYENGAKILNMASGSLLETITFDFYVDCSTPVPTIPSAPTNLVAEVKSSSEIQLSWDDVEGAEYYNIYSGDVYLGYIAIPVCIVSNVEYGTHCFTVTATNEVGESECSNEACATIELPNFWTPDPYLYANNMTIITTIAIDGVEQSDLNLELGAFCGDEVRGSGRLQYVGAPANRYECFLMVYGNSNDNITFKLYDHSTATVSDIKSNQSVLFEVNGTVGDIVNPYIINFINTIVHNQALTSGWNWYSTYVINEGAEGLANLENAIGTNGIQIKNQTQFVNQASGNWYGTLEETSVEDMYMIQLSSATNVTLEGYEVNSAEHPITLGTNWKWISYPLSASISVEEAFASANPSNGDYVKSQTGFAQYYDGLGWSGTLTNMTPGMGYMYQNKSGYAKTLVYPTPNSKSVSESMSESESIYHWTADYAQYPMNMTMIAVVEGAEKDYEVAAFANGECRGSARPIYIEALDSYMIFITISGDDNESLTFKYYDVTTGEEVAIENNMIFTVNATVGDVMNPYVMTRGTMGIDDLSSSINIYPNPVEDELFVVTEMNVEEVTIYDVYGRLCCRDASNASTSTMDTFNVSVQDLEAGVYFVNIKTDGGNIVKRFVKK